MRIQEIKTGGAVMNVAGRRMYTTKEVLKIVGISRATLYNWFRYKKIKDVARDRNDFRVFTDSDIKRILTYKNMIKEPS